MARSARPASVSRTVRTRLSRGCGSTVTRPPVSRERSNRLTYPESNRVEVATVGDFAASRLGG